MLTAIRNIIRPWPAFSLKRLPLVTLLLSVAALYAWSMQRALEYDRAAISAGQGWRFLTCHWTHFSWDHLLWDVGTFVLLAGICEVRDRTMFIACTVISATMISAAVWIFLPHMQTFRGLSGIDSALLTLLAVDLLRAQIRPGGRIGFAAGIGVVLILFMVKIVVEVHSGRSVFVDSAAAKMVPVPLAHCVGALVGMLCALGVGVAPVTKTASTWHDGVNA